ncbi:MULTISPECIES: TauD/TfdA family dioxygenase [unclassified Streptomyces]|uniref:TauD/TfdA family dioxygenase n=1 Tax=unclassified Streptomyces TaxID=2593676 RepID=UPI00341AFD90
MNAHLTTADRRKPASSPLASAPLDDGPGIVPARIPAHDTQRARTLLVRDGAIVLTGYSTTADAPVSAAAQILGSRLRELFPQRLRTSRDGEAVHLHADSFDLVIDIGGIPRRRRDPDEDYVLVQCLHPAPTGGDSFAADAYRFIDNCETTDPELWTFLTGTDIDLYGAWADLRGLPATPRVARHVEYTRTGRRIVRRTDGALPLHRDPESDHVRTMLDHFHDTVHAMEPALPRFSLDKGDILVLDNYRCWHGRDAHSGDRSVRILTLQSTEAR